MYVKIIARFILNFLHGNGLTIIFRTKVVFYVLAGTIFSGLTLVSCVAKTISLCVEKDETFYLFRLNINQFYFSEIGIKPLPYKQCSRKEVD